MISGSHISNMIYRAHLVHCDDQSSLSLQHLKDLAESRESNDRCTTIPTVTVHWLTNNLLKLERRTRPPDHRSEKREKGSKVARIGNIRGPLSIANKHAIVHLH